jgi:hypothetical protein
MDIELPTLLVFYDFKSSALIMLFHGLDDNSQHELGHLGTMSRKRELQAMSRRTKVQLVATEQGWKFSAVDT